MSTRLKERGGSGGKIMASNPYKALPIDSLKEKSSTRPISAGRFSAARSNPSMSMSSGKENPRTISTIRPTVARFPSITPCKQNQRPVSVGRSSIAVKPADPTVVRRSTSSMTIPFVQSSRDRRKFAESMPLDKDQARIERRDLNSNGNGGKSLNVIAEVFDDKSVRNAYKIADLKPKQVCSKPKDSKISFSNFQQILFGSNRKSMNGNGVNGVVLQKLNKEKQFKVEGDAGEEEALVPGFINGDVKASESSKEIPFINLASKSIWEQKEDICIDGTKHVIAKDYLDSSKLSNGKSDSINNSVIDSEGNVETAVKYQSKLHEKLALLEEKVQRIALEIKLTKELLDKNKLGESKIDLSNIQKKVYGVEKAVHNLNDGAKSESSFSDSRKMGLLIENSSSSIESLNNGALEARFFPHRITANDSSNVDCKSSFSIMNGDPKDDHGLTDRKRFTLELSHGVVSKVQLDRASSSQSRSTGVIGDRIEDIAFESSEKLEEFDVLESNPPLMESLGSEEPSINQLNEIGRKISTGGWFVSEGEAILLAHDDNSCSYYDIGNNEVKSEYKPPAGLSSNLWGDCWLIRAPGADGCSGQYIVAASAGNALDFGFCSWDFYTKDIKTFHTFGETRNNGLGLSTTKSSPEGRSCWYRPCGPLLIAASGRGRAVEAYDIRDGDLVMTWEARGPVAEMEFSSPLQWRSRGKVVIAEKEAIRLWDVNSLEPLPVLTVPFVGKKIHSLHVNNTDAEIAAGVRQRASSSEVEGNDGVFCTQEGATVLDFRVPSGAGLKIPRHGATALSIFSLKDSIFIGSTEARSQVRSGPRSQVEHFSLRKGKLVAAYVMPEFNSHYHHSSVSQVWGNSSVAMGICGMGMFVFNVLGDEGLSSFSGKRSSAEARETIGPDDLYRPTFDYAESRALIISRDRPAFWRYLL